MKDKRTGFRKLTDDDMRAIAKQMYRFASMTEAQRETAAEHMEAHWPPGTRMTVGPFGIPHVELPIRFIVSDVLPKA